MKCPKCGYDVVGLKFCPVCGARFGYSTMTDEERAQKKSEQAQEQRREQAREQARERAQEQAREQAQEKRKEQAQAEDADDEPIVIDPRKAYMHDGRGGRRGGGGAFFDMGDLFGGLFGGGGGFFGSPFRGGGGFGLFDIFEGLFDGFGASPRSRRSNRVQIAEPDDFYQIDEYDEEGFPIVRKDKMIDVSASEFERIRKESNKSRKKK